MSSFSIIAAAKALPQRIVSNEDLAQLMDTSDAWIRQRTGIQTRHIAVTETTTSLCTQVAQSLLKKAVLLPEAIDLIVVATMSPDAHTPSTAAGVQGNIAATNAIAFDLNAACSGFVYGLNLLDQVMQSGHYRNAILIGGELLSRWLDWHDRTTAVLFGDGAGGVLVTRSAQYQGKVLGRHLKTLGQLGHHLIAGQMPRQTEFGRTDPAISSPDHFFHMAGRQIYAFAVKQVPLSILAACQEAQITLHDIDCFVMHQANARIITSVAKEMGLPSDKFPMNIAHYGNTAAASEPILLAELIAAQKIKRGDVVALTGFGGGLTIGTMIIKY